MKLTARQIERLVKQGEVVHTECKDACGGMPDALWESYSSFANTDGGVIPYAYEDKDVRIYIKSVRTDTSGSCDEEEVVVFLGNFEEIIKQGKLKVETEKLSKPADISGSDSL